MKYLSLFTGIGGFELGIQNAHRNLLGRTVSTVELQPQTEFGEPTGQSILSVDGRTEPPSERLRESECIGYSEVDKYAVQIYQRHYPDHHNYGDITKINEQELPDFDLLVGGFPCQSFSIAGKRGGFSDTRGTLFFDIARILQAKQPRLLLLENVKGLLSHDNGRTFGTIVSTLDELGYDIQWQVLNSKDFSVPQNRERVLIVGHLRGTPRPQVFPLEGTDGTDIDRLSGEVRVHSTQKRSAGRPSLKYSSGGSGQLSREDGISYCIDTGGTQAIEVARTVRSGGRSSPHGSKQNWDSYEFDGAIRRLTPTECERLQGFPDGWTEGVSDTQRYKTLGNAVTTNVIAAVIKKMI